MSYESDSELSVGCTDGSCGRRFYHLYRGIHDRDSCRKDLPESAFRHTTLQLNGGSASDGGFHGNMETAGFSRGTGGNKVRDRMGENITCVFLILHRKIKSNEMQ